MTYTTYLLYFTSSVYSVIQESNLHVNKMWVPDVLFNLLDHIDTFVWNISLLCAFFMGFKLSLRGQSGQRIRPHLHLPPMVMPPPYYRGHHFSPRVRPPIFHPYAGTWGPRPNLQQSPHSLPHANHAEIRPVTAQTGTGVSDWSHNIGAGGKPISSDTESDSPAINSARSDPDQKKFVDSCAGASASDTKSDNPHQRDNKAASCPGSNSVLPDHVPKTVDNTRAGRKLIPSADKSDNPNPPMSNPENDIEDVICMGEVRLAIIVSYCLELRHPFVNLPMISDFYRVDRVHL